MKHFFTVTIVTGGIKWVNDPKLLNGSFQNACNWLNCLAVRILDCFCCIFAPHVFHVTQFLPLVDLIPGVSRLAP